MRNLIHELMQYLTIIGGQAEILLGRAVDVSDQRRLELIRSTAKKVAERLRELQESEDEARALLAGRALDEIEKVIAIDRKA